MAAAAHSNDASQSNRPWTAAMIMDEHAAITLELKSRRRTRCPGRRARQSRRTTRIGAACRRSSSREKLQARGGSPEARGAAPKLGAQPRAPEALGGRGRRPRASPRTGAGAPGGEDRGEPRAGKGRGTGAAEATAPRHGNARPRVGQCEDGEAGRARAGGRFGTQRRQHDSAASAPRRVAGPLRRRPTELGDAPAASMALVAEVKSGAGASQTPGQHQRGGRGSALRAARRDQSFAPRATARVVAARKTPR